MCMTMRELAKLCNVSVSTVSKAFVDADDVSESTKKHIFNISQKISKNSLTMAVGYGNIANTSKRVYFFVPKNQHRTTKENITKYIKPSFFVQAPKPANSIASTI